MVKNLVTLLLSCLLLLGAVAPAHSEEEIRSDFIQLAMQVEQREVNCLAEAIYFEARGEPFLGQLAVAHVIRNRTLVAEKFPSSVCEVIRQPGQFSYDHKAKITNFDLWIQLRMLAEQVLLGQGIDPTKGSLFFGTLTQQFICVKHQKKVIGNHRFC